MAPLTARIASFFALVLALLSAGARAAHAQGDGATPSPPRDVAAADDEAAGRLVPAPPDFVRVERGWLTIELPASVSDRAEALARQADEQRARLSEELGQPLLEHALVRVARTPDQMAELSPEGWPPPPYASGVAYPSLHLVLLALRAPDTWEAPDLEEVMRHELTHLALADAVGGHHVPRWFNEGLAIYESGEFPWARRAALAEASFSRGLLPLDELDAGFPADRYAVNVAYAESASVVGFLLRASDRARFGSLIERVRAGAPFDRALGDAYSTDLRKLEYEWREEVSRHFSVVPALTGGGIVWVVISALVALAWLKRRRRAREKLAQWAREEAAADAARAAALVAASPQDARLTPAEDDMPSAPKPGIPVVEHEGRWYTVH